MVRWLNRKSERDFVSRPTLVRYGVAVTSVVVALVLKLLLNPVIGQEATPFRLFLAAIVISAWFGGLLPGLFATFLTIPIVNYFFLHPVSTFTGLGPTVGSLGLFAVEGVLVSALVAALHTARGRAEAKTAEARAHQEDLRRSEERFRSLVQYASDVITVLEADGTIRYQSPSIERVLGYRPEEMVGKHAFDYVYPQDAERVWRVFTDGVDVGEPTATVEFRFRHKDCSWRYLEAIGNNLLEDPAVGGIVVNSRDVTERKRAEEVLRRSLDALLALYETGQVLSASLEREEIGLKLLEITRRVSSSSAAILSLQDGSAPLKTWRASGPEEVLASVSSDPRVEAARRETLENGTPHSIKLQQPAPETASPLTGVLLPLRVRNHTIGVMEAYGPESLGEKESVDTLGSLASQAASALENARLYEELYEREEQLEELVGKLISAQEEERRRVAYEVHDGLTQVMVAAYQYLQDFADVYPPSSEQAREELEEAIELVRRSVGEARRVISNLRPTTLDDLGLSAALRQLVSELRGEPRKVEYTESLGEERLPSEMEITLFRVAQEALTNVRKHAGKGAPVQVSLEREENIVRLTVEDEGHGFDPKNLRSGSGPGERVGLSSMRERVALLGGELVIRSEPGAGTLVVAETPLLTEVGYEGGGEHITGGENR